MGIEALRFDKRMIKTLKVVHDINKNVLQQRKQKSTTTEKNTQIQSHIAQVGHMSLYANTQCQ